MFELWDRTSGNRLGEYPSEGKALSAVRKLQKHVGPSAAEQLALGSVDDRGIRASSQLGAHSLL